MHTSLFSSSLIGLMKFMRDILWQLNSKRHLRNHTMCKSLYLLTYLFNFSVAPSLPNHLRGSKFYFLRKLMRREEGKQLIFNIKYYMLRTLSTFYLMLTVTLHEATLLHLMVAKLSHGDMNCLLCIWHAVHL